MKPANRATNDRRMQTSQDSFDVKRVDPRIYLGILVFRWKLIAACFLYCLLGGVVYLELAPKLYSTRAVVMIYRDPSTQIGGQTYHWSQASTHVALLQSEGFQKMVASELENGWLRRLGNPRLLLPYVDIKRQRSEGITIELSIRNAHPAYARAFLRQMIAEFQKQREVVKERSYGSAMRSLQAELQRLREQIRAAEDELIEFQRVNQMELVQARGSMELQYLRELMGRHHQLSTELWLLDLQYPRLKGQSPEMIRDAMNLTRVTGSIAPRTRMPAGTGASAAADGAGGRQEGRAEGTTAGPDAVAEEDLPELPPVEKFAPEEIPGLQDVRVRLARLERERKELEPNTQPDHPKIRALDEEIKALKQSIEFTGELQYARLRERHEAVRMQLEALEEAQRRWRNSYLLASKKHADMRQLESSIQTLEAMYRDLASRLNSLLVDREIKGEQFSVLIPPRSSDRPTWPDPWKILIMVLSLGAGSGVGLALLAYVFDDKVQSIRDVEETVGVPFLGGVPFWVHSDLQTRIRPIVTDQHKGGASEAYRALRTNVLSALEKSGRKVVLMTSADSKEGKTLTVLNLALMIAKTGKRVLLMDMDLRRGVLHKSLEMERAPGLTDSLESGRPIMDVAVATAHENLWFAPAGAVKKTTAELLHKADLLPWLGAAAERFDYVLMDSAPVLRVTDTVIIAGCPIVSVIYVAHANRTPKPLVKYSLDMLGEAHILGLIVNSIEMHRISSLYYTYQYPNYAYYSYAYAYGYDYDLYSEQASRRMRRRPGFFRSLRRRAADWVRRNLIPSR